LADALLSRGFRDITVLDISVTGMQDAQDRLGAHAQQVQWLATDVLAWEPLRRFGVWHDRAVFHFLTSPPGQHRYVRVLDAATETDTVAVFGCFAPDGPQRCSGLPVARYDIPALAAHLGPAWTLCAGDREEHITPAGVMQPFTWAAFRKAPGHGHANGTRTFCGVRRQPERGQLYAADLGFQVAVGGRLTVGRPD
jgi:hypothetical protein